MYNRAVFSTLNQLLSANVINNNQFYFVKSDLKFSFEKDKLFLNYDFSFYSIHTDLNGQGFINDNNPMENIANIVYQKCFDDEDKKLDFSFNFSNNRSNYLLNDINTNSALLNNDSDQNYYQFKPNYSQKISVFSDTKLVSVIFADQLDFRTQSFNVTNLNYRRNAFAAYSELQMRYKKFNFIIWIYDWNHAKLWASQHSKTSFSTNTFVSKFEY